jgi:hypothetical protein
LSLEAIDNLVTLVIRAPNGERRAIAWDGEEQVVAAFARPTRSTEVGETSGLDTDGVAAFCSELVGAGVLVAAPAT